MIKNVSVRADGTMVHNIVCSKCDQERVNDESKQDIWNEEKAAFRCPFCKGRGITQFNDENVYEPCKRCERKGFIWA